MFIVPRATLLLVVSRCPECRRTASATWPALWGDCERCGARVPFPWRDRGFVA